MVCSFVGLIGIYKNYLVVIISKISHGDYPIIMENP